MKTDVPALPHKLRTEMYDKVNLMCRNYMDRMIHFGADYDFIVDEKAFKAVMSRFFDAAPVFRSQLIKSPIAPYWRVCDYSIDEAVTVSSPEDLQAAKDAFFTQCIPLDSNLQMKAALFYADGKTSVCFIWNHMCMDGGGFKAFFATLCSAYTAYVNNEPCTEQFATGTRSYDRVYQDFSEQDRAKAKKLYANVTPKDSHRFPFSPDSDGDSVVIVRRKIDADTFSNARAACKTAGASVNDLIVAAYVDAYAALTNLGEQESINVTSAVDLRRYIKNPAEIGYTNHVTFIHCYLDSGRGSGMGETLKRVAAVTAKAKQDPFMGLHGLPLLNLSYSSMVYLQAETVIKLFYKNPPLAVSNIGALDPAAYSLGGNAPVDAYFCGAAKNKPCAMLSALSINGVLSLAVCVRGNEKDRAILNGFFDAIENSIARLI